MTKYRKPTGQYIGDGAEKLYELETRRNDAIKACAEEQGKILGFKRSEFWTHSLPEALLATLNSFDRTASGLAAEAFLATMAHAEDRAVDRVIEASGMAALGKPQKKICVRPTRVTERVTPERDLFIAWFDGDAAGTCADTESDAISKLLTLNP